MTQCEIKNFVISTRGTIPVILTAPHGGRLDIPGLTIRESGTFERDIGTAEMAQELTECLKNLIGQNPYVVIAEFHRKYIDVNRPEATAFEDTKAKPYYLAYHTIIRNFLDQIRTNNPPGAILIDIHGQASQGELDKVHRGTRNGMTVQNILKRCGLEAFIGAESILGHL